MPDAGRPPSVRLRGHSYIAYALTPDWPITQWLSELDESTYCFADFLVSKPIVLDLSKVTLSQSGVAHLIAELQTRNIHIMGIEGAGELGPELPPVCEAAVPRGRWSPLILGQDGGRATRSAGTGIVVARQSGAFGSIRHIPGRRCHGPGLRRVRGRNCGRRLHPCVWHTARSGPCRLDRQSPRPDLLQKDRSRIAGNRRDLSHH